MPLSPNAEVPVSVPDRIRGESKFGLLQMVDYCRRLMILAGSAVSMGNAARFAVVGLVGLVVDFLVFDALFLSGFKLVTAHVTSFAVATVTNYVLNSQWTFADAVRASPEAHWQRYGRFLAIGLMALFLRDGFLAAAIEAWKWPPELAILLGVTAAAAVNYLGNAFFVFPATSRRVSRSIRWRIAALGVFAYVVVLRLVFLGLPDLLPEEAYYWNYSQHLDIGYLDHPPMVAWLIWLGTALFGNTEFGVRIGAFMSWFAAAYFCFHFTRNLFGKSAAFVAVLLLAVMPYFFAAGLLMMPDAPLTAAWAGALYFLERALLGERRAAWWGVGASIGLGMVSKYTIVLLCPATLILVLLEPHSRRWLARPEPYGAVLLAILLFSPVIFWNATHDWASFAFQGSRRLEALVNFSLHKLLGAVLVLLTPVGLIAAASALFPGKDRESAGDGQAAAAGRRRRFIAVFTLVPLSVFVAYSLFHSVKLNWTGPLWLAVLPAVAANILGAASAAPRLDAVLRRVWVPTVAITLIVYGFGLDYLVLGLPGVGYFSNIGSLPIGWEKLGRQAEQIEDHVARETGQEPLVVGMDQYFVASQLAFYRRGDNDGARTTAGRGLFGGNGLMYNYWFSPAASQGKTVIMFGLKPAILDHSDMKKQFSSVTPIKEELITRDDSVVGRFYYRIGYDFRAP